MDGSAGDIAIIIGGIGGAAAAIIASWRGVKKPVEEPPPAAIVGGTLFGATDLSRVGDWLAATRNAVERLREQQHDDSRELRQAIERQTNAIERNTEAVGESSVSPREFASMIGQLDRMTKGAAE